MSHLGNVVLVTEDPLCDPMGEFHVEDDDPTRPMPGGSLLQRVSAISRIAMPLAPAPPAEAPAPAVEEPALPVEAPATQVEAQVTPVEPPALPAEPPAAVADVVRPVAAPVAAAQRGRWFVGMTGTPLHSLERARVYPKKSIYSRVPAA